MAVLGSDNLTHSTTFKFNINSADRVTIDDSGRLLVGTSTARANFVTVISPRVQVEGTDADSSSIAIIRNTEVLSQSPFLTLLKARGTVVGSNNSVISDESLGRVIFAGNDGTAFINAGQIDCLVDGTPGANNMPGCLVFSTTAAGESSPTEHMRIRENGRIGMGATLPSTTVHIRTPNQFNASNGNTSSGLLVQQSGGTLGSGNYGTAICLSKIDSARPGGVIASVQTSSNQNQLGLAFLAHGSTSFSDDVEEKMRILHDGTLCLNSAGPLDDELFTVFTGANTGISIRNALSGLVRRPIRFYNGTSIVGSITTNSSSTAYNTSSDYRLKENIVNLDGAIDRLKQLPVHRFNFITAPDTIVDGFIAHEAQEVVPECVTGTKDEVQAIGTLTEWNGTVINTDVPETEELTWEDSVEVTPAADATYDEEGNELTPAVDAVYETVTRTRTWEQTGERPVYQGIDQSKIVPLLTAALQEAIEKIETLEARVLELEAS